MNAEQMTFITNLYLSKRKFLLEYAYGSLKSRSMAEEAVQEAFKIACEKPNDLCSSSNPEGWIVKTTAFVINNIERRQKMLSKIIVDLDEYRPDLVAAPQDPPSLEDRFGKIVDTPQFKMVYAMAVEGKSIMELADELGISVDACKKRAERARKFLHKKIK